jgi:hypothetical protein
MKLMTAAQVAEARAQEISNKGLAVSLMMKEEAIATNMRLAASSNALAASNVLVAHSMFGVAPLPKSIRPGSSRADARSAAMGLLSPSEAKQLRDFDKYQSAVAAGKKPKGPAPKPSQILRSQGAASAVAGTVAASAVLSPNLLRTFQGADLGLMGMPLTKGSGSIAQLMQQELERDMLRMRNAALASGAIGGPRVYGNAVEKQFASYLSKSGYSPERKMQEMAMLAGSTGRIGKAKVDPSFFRVATGMSPEFLAGTMISGQAVKKISSKTQLGSKGMANVIHNERLFQLAEMQRNNVPVAAQASAQAALLQQQAAAAGLSGKAADDFVRKNMPRTLSAHGLPSAGSVAPQAPAQITKTTPRTQARRFIPPVPPRQKHSFRLGGNQFPYTPSPYVSVPDGPVSPDRAKGMPKSGARHRVAGVTPTDLRKIPPRMIAAPMAGVGTAIAGAATTAARDAGRATGNAVRFLGNRGADVIHAAGEAAGRTAESIRRTGRAIASGAAHVGAATADTASYYGQRAARRGRIIGNAAMFAGAGALSRGRAAAFRGFEGITGQTGGLPAVVSRAALNASRQAALVAEFTRLQDAGTLAPGMTQDQFVSKGMKKQGGIRGRTREIRSAARGAQGMQTTGFLRGVERGSRGAGYLTKAVTSALIMPLKAPFKAIGKLGTIAGKGLASAAKGGGILAKIATPLMAMGGKAGIGAGVALGAAMKLALPLTIVFWNAGHN